METIRFNRHEIFTAEDHKFHSRTIRLVEDWYISQNKTWFTELYNELCGIWDGYLYYNILELAYKDLPEALVERIKTTANLIKKEVVK